MLTTVMLLLATASSPHHVETLASVGLASTDIDTGGYPQPVGIGGAIGLAGSYRYGLSKWFEIGPTAEGHYFAGRDGKHFSPAALTSVVGSLRFRTPRSKAFVLDAGAGVLRLDAWVESNSSGSISGRCSRPCD
ncbi:MAG: hypothetical protein ACXVEF_21370 [Polyangiales bacterium]